MSWKLLLVIVAVLVVLTVIGFALGAGQPRLVEGELPEPPGWLDTIGRALNDSKPLRAADISGCALDHEVLHLDDSRPRATCDIREVEEGTRTVRLSLEAGRATIRARTRGRYAAEAEVKLPGDEDVRAGDLRIEPEGATLTVTCTSRPCRLVFAQPEGT